MQHPPLRPYDGFVVGSVRRSGARRMDHQERSASASISVQDMREKIAAYKNVTAKSFAVMNLELIVMSKVTRNAFFRRRLRH